MPGRERAVCRQVMLIVTRRGGAGDRVGSRDGAEEPADLALYRRGRARGLRPPGGRPAERDAVRAAPPHPGRRARSRRGDFRAAQRGHAADRGWRGADPLDPHAAWPICAASIRRSSELAGLQRGEIRIACSQAVVRSFVVHELVAFRATAPEGALQGDRSPIIAARSSSLVGFRDGSRARSSARCARPSCMPLMSVGQGLVAVMRGGPSARRDTRRSGCGNAPTTRSRCPTAASAGARSSTIGSRRARRS